MSALQPLLEWYCDSCDEVIKCPKDGYVIWHGERDDQYRAFGFRIIHHAPKSPGYPERSCDPGSMSSLALPDMVGPVGLIRALARIDRGRSHETEDYGGPHVRSLPEWCELVRRLHVPYYEEARRYWDEAEADGFIGDASEVRVYMEDFLKELIETYGEVGC